MPSPLLILAQAAGPAADAAAHGEAARGITKITQEFGLSWAFLLAQILNFSVVAFLEVPRKAASGITKITQEFGLSGPFLLAQILNFSVVAFLLWRFAFKPVLSMLDERQQKIAAGLKYAEEMKAKLDAEIGRAHV